MIKFSLVIILILAVFSIPSAFAVSFEIHAEQYRIGHDITLILYDPDLNRDSDKAESYSLDLIAFHFGNDKVTLGPKGDIKAFDPNPSRLRETGDNTGIFYTVIKIPRIVDGKTVKFGEKIAFEYTDFGAFASVFVGANEEKVFSQPTSQKSIQSDFRVTIPDFNINATQGEIQKIPTIPPLEPKASSPQLILEKELPDPGPPEGWQRLQDMPEVRSEMEAAAIGNKIYVVGGLNNRGEATNTVFIFDTKDAVWSLGTPMSLSLHHAGAASYDEKLYIVGGYLDAWIPSNSLLIYDSKTNTWTIGPDMPTPRGALTAQFLDGKLYAIGGFSGDVLSVNEVYDPKTDTWETKSEMPTPREHLTSAILDDQLYVIGGRDRQFNLNHNERYDHQTDSWETLEPLPTARSGLTASVLSGAIFVFGGESAQKTFEENEAYIPGEGWFPQQPMPISRHGLSSATVENNIYVIGGGVVPGFSFSGITEVYHNTVIPEFGTVAFAILGFSFIALIIISSLKHKESLIQNIKV